MVDFDYLRPKSIAEACAARTHYGKKGRVLAGGTDLLVQLRARDKRWNELEILIDCADLEEMRSIRLTESFLEIGACATYTELESHVAVLQHFSFLAEAAHSVGAVQIRNLGTIGGGICNGSPASDPLSPLVAVDAVACLRSEQGTRSLPIAELYSGANSLCIRDDEILTHFILPLFPETSRFAFVKLGRRKALAISRINVAVALHLDEQQRVDDIRIAPGCVFPTPMRVREAEQLILGQQITDQNIAQAGQAVSAAMIERTGVRWSTEYKQPVVEALTERALRQAAGVKQ